MSEMQLKTMVKVLPIIEFNEYDKLKNEAEIIANKLNSMEVTEENIKEQKKLLANVNKSIKNLNDKRIQIKKEINEPYEEFAKKVKEIESVVKSADERLRSQVREIEENRRLEKEKEIKDIWNMRIQVYEFAKTMNFESFLKPQHLNATTSISKVEDEMTEFLEKSENDLELLSGMVDAPQLMAEYRDCLDVATSIKTVTDLIKKRLEEEKLIREVKKEENQKIYSIIIKSEKDFKMAKLLLEQNEIEFEIKEL